MNSRNGMIDVWGKLWDIATGDDEAHGEPATIVPDPDDPGRVLLRYPDGICVALYWDDGDWHFAEALNTCPCDVAARDSL